MREGAFDVALVRLTVECARYREALEALRVLLDPERPDAPATVVQVAGAIVREALTP